MKWIANETNDFMRLYLVHFHTFSQPIEPPPPNSNALQRTVSSNLLQRQNSILGARLRRPSFRSEHIPLLINSYLPFKTGPVDSLGRGFINLYYDDLEPQDRFLNERRSSFNFLRKRFLIFLYFFFLCWKKDNKLSNYKRIAVDSKTTVDEVIEIYLKGVNLRELPVDDFLLYEIRISPDNVITYGNDFFFKKITMKNNILNQLPFFFSRTTCYLQ